MAPDAQPPPDSALEAMRAERDQALRELETTRVAWRATLKTKDALALLVSEDVLRAVRVYLPTLTDDQRVEFFYAVEQGFCGSCGRKLEEDSVMGCSCTNDE